MLQLFIVPCHVSSSDAWLDCTCVITWWKLQTKRNMTHKSSLVTRRFCLQGQENMSADLILVWLIRKWQSSRPRRTNKFFSVIVTIVLDNFRLVHCHILRFYEKLMRHPKYIEPTELVRTIWSNRKRINWWFGLVEISCQPQERCRLAKLTTQELSQEIMSRGKIVTWICCNHKTVSKRKLSGWELEFAKIVTSSDVI